MRQGTTTSNRWAAVASAAAVLAMAAAGCGDAAGTSAATSAGPRSAADSSTVTTTVQTQPTIDPAVAVWARAWKRKVEAPMERATARLAASIDAALAGNSTAAYRLTRPLDALSNCRNPLEMGGLAQTPPELVTARRRTLSACREIFIGTNGFVAGLNSLSPTRANAGIARIWHGVASLRRIAHEVKRATQPQ